MFVGITVNHTTRIFLCFPVGASELQVNTEHPLTQATHATGLPTLKDGEE